MFEWFADAFRLFVRWLECIHNPVRVWKDLLKPESDDPTKIRKSLELWAMISFLTFVVLLPTFKISGVDYEDSAFYMPYAIWILVSQLCFVGLIHAGLRIYRIPSRFPDTLAVHTVSAGAFAPFQAIVLSGFQMTVFRQIKAWKASGSPLEELLTWNPLLSDLSEVSSIGLLLAFVLQIVVASLLARALRDHYKQPAIRVWESLAFSVGVLTFVYSIVLGPLYFFLVYVAL